jgi:hypothetical protein
MIKNVFASLLTAVLLSTALAAAEKTHLLSQLRDGAITVDGQFDDWYGNLQPLAVAPVSVQALNDGEFLYLRLTASDAATRMQIMRQGLTVWFDPAGGTKKKLGIRYPVVEPGEHGRGRGGYGRGGHGGGDRPGEGGGQGDGVDSERDAPVNRVDILGPGKDEARSLTREHLSGVDVAVHAEQGLLQYELKVPLTQNSDHPYAIEAQPGKTIGLGLETGAMQHHAGPEGGRGGYGGGMGGRGGGGMGGRGRGMGGGGRHGGGGERGFQPPKPLKVWATVAIAPAR